MLRFFKRRKEKERLKALECFDDIDTDAIAHKHYGEFNYFGRTHQKGYTECKHCKADLVFYQEVIHLKFFKRIHSVNGVNFTVCSGCGKLKRGWEV